MKKKTFFIITSIIGLLITYFVYSNVDLFLLLKYLLMVISYKIFPYFFVTLLTHILLAYKWDIILRSMEYKIQFYKLFFYRLAGYAVSYLTPSAHVGGEGVRAMLLKRHKIGFSKGLSSVVIEKSIEIVFSIFFVIIGFVILIFNYTLPSNSIIIIYSLSFLLLFFLIFYYRMSKGLYFFGSLFKLMNIKYKHILKIQEFERNVSNFFQHHKKVFYKLLIISILQWILMFFEYGLLLNLLHIHINFINIFLVLFAVNLAYIVPLPAALGVLEAFQVSVFRIINLNAAYAIVVSIVIRLKDLFWTIIGLLLLSYYGIKIKFFDNGRK